MQDPFPLPPPDAPPETITLIEPIGWFSIGLTVTADDLIPEEISRVFGVEPTRSRTKGVPVLDADWPPLVKLPDHGSWKLQIKKHQTDEWDVGSAVEELLAMLPKDLEVWRPVFEKCSLRLSIGLDLTGWNGDFTLQPELLRFLGERQISVWFDVYCDAAREND
ncbi:DUF4279 domain-containing protein [Hydrogenophaga palleronii]|uniref:DUF4279 domain-containing protein n=1 Tax=Hydrogenophaga palleronii TaxID=65655 RepID=UPI001470CD67|nr:DUF4279 domain-containing protein [Hydrogenophaga palleronii]